MRCVRALLAVWALLCLVPAVATAVTPDSAAPPGADPDWLPEEEWVMERWMPFDEARLVRTLRMDRYSIHVYLDRTRRSLNDLAHTRGVSDRRLAERLVGVSGAPTPQQALRLQLARRVLDQPHLADHMLSHAFHHWAVTTEAQRIFGVSPSEYHRLRYVDERLLPFQVAQRSGISREHLVSRLLRVLRDTGKRGVARGVMSRAQLRERQRQLRAHVDEWIGGPRPLLRTARPASHRPRLLCAIGKRRTAL